jgi:hypothetical protein
LAAIPTPERQNALIVVAKRPAPGRTKTRLTPPLYPVEAAQLYECLLKDTLVLVRGLEQVHLVIAYLPDDEAQYFARLAPDFDLLPQRGSGLGERLDLALKHYLRLGYRRVAVANSDGPTLPPAYLVACFDALSAGSDVVIGPCLDGGYYLLGTSQPIPHLTRHVEMSTSRVTADTLALAVEEGLRVHLLPHWYDVDDVPTLWRLIAELDERTEIAAHTRRFLRRYHRTNCPGSQESGED